jgi:hypothetical protein
MNRRIIPLIASLALVVSAATSDASTSPVRKAQDVIEVHWGRKAFEVEELPDEMGPGARAAVALWAGWAADHGYRMELSEDGCVLLLLQAKRTPKKELKLIEETLEMFNELLPAPERGTGGEPLPRLAQGGPLAAMEGAWVRAPWIQAGPEADTETIVLLGLGDQKDYASVVDLMVDGNPYLAQWAPSGKRAAGFVLEQPLCGSWLLGSAAPEECDPHNELVHRLARLLLLRRYGRQPWWLTLGLAWHMEIELRGTVYCFPGRGGFVSCHMHGSWPNNLRNMARKDEPDITWERLSCWKRGAWNDGDATRAWGVAKYISLARSDALPFILEDFRSLGNMLGIERRTDGSWRVLTDYTVSQEDQQGILEAHLGEGFEEEMLKAFSKSKWPRKRRR